MGWIADGGFGFAAVRTLERSTDIDFGLLGTGIVAVKTGCLVAA